MVKIIDLKQNTPEWDLFRKSHIGASDTPIILGKSSFCTPYELFLDKCFNESKELTEAMKRGQFLEPVARRDFEEERKRRFEPRLGQSTQYPWLIASLDGFNGAEILEIKCPGERVLQQAVYKGIIPEYWEWQVQHQMIVFNTLVTWIYVWGDAGNMIATFERKPDWDMQQIIIPKTKVFWDKMIRFEPPYAL